MNVVTMQNHLPYDGRYDDPVHAPLGMRAARRYGAVAPNAGHALHMTSHIFIALGLWDDVIDATRRAIAVVNKQRAARAKPPADCGHYPTWLHYAYLQEGRFEEASKALEACRAFAFTDQAEGLMGEYADMRANQIAGVCIERSFERRGHSARVQTFH